MQSNVFTTSAAPKKSFKNLFKVSGNELNEWLYKIRPEFQMIQQLTFKDEDELKICANLLLLITRNTVVPYIILEEEPTRRHSLINLKGIKNTLNSYECRLVI